jgi:F-box-like
MDSPLDPRALSFGSARNLESLQREVTEHKAAIKLEEYAAMKQVDDIWAATQPNIDTAREELRKLDARIAQMESEREGRKKEIMQSAFKRTAPTRKALADAKHELAAISAPILRLPVECTAEIFQWHFEIGGVSMLAASVCRRWAFIARSIPALWSRIAVTDREDPRQVLHLMGSHECRSIPILKVFLSMAKDAPLEIELARFKTPNPPSPPQINLNSTPLWTDEALRLLAADGRCRLWKSLYITSWNGGDQAPCAAIQGPFDNLRYLFIRGFPYPPRPSYYPLITSILQSAPKLSHIDTSDSIVVRSMKDWTSASFWERIEQYGNLSSPTDRRFLANARRLRELTLVDWRERVHTDKVLLPSLRTLCIIRSGAEAIGDFELPVLETLIMKNSDGFRTPVPGSIHLPAATALVSVDCRDVRGLLGFQAPALRHLHLACHHHMGRNSQSKEWQRSFMETFEACEFMRSLTSLHLEVPISDPEILSALNHIPQLQEFKISPVQYFPGSKFWAGLTPKGTRTRKQGTHCCPILKILVLEVKDPYYGGQGLSLPRISELAHELANARRTEGHPLTHLLIRLGDGIVHEIIGDFKTLPSYPVS